MLGIIFLLCGLTLLVWIWICLTLILGKVLGLGLSVFPSLGLGEILACDTFAIVVVGIWHFCYCCWYWPLNPQVFKYKYNKDVSKHFKPNWVVVYEPSWKFLIATDNVFCFSIFQKRSNLNCTCLFVAYLSNWNKATAILWSTSLSISKLP